MMTTPTPTPTRTTRLAPRVVRLDLGRRHLFRHRLRLDVAHRSTADSDSEYSILRPLAARDDARFRDCNRTSHSSLTRRLHLTIRASRRPRRLGARALSQKTPHQSPRARSVVTTARARRPSSCRAKRARGNPCRMPIAVRARRRGWYARALPTTTNHSRCVRSTGNFKSERLGRTSARWRRSRDDERRTKTSW